MLSSVPVQVHGPARAGILAVIVEEWSSTLRITVAPSAVIGKGLVQVPPNSVPFHWGPFRPIVAQFVPATDRLLPLSLTVAYWRSACRPSLACIVPWLVKLLGLIVIVPPASSPQLIACTTVLRKHLDAVDHGGQPPRDEIHRDLPVAVGRGCKLLDHRLVHTSRRCGDVEVRQDLGAVDAHVELPLAPAV